METYRMGSPFREEYRTVAASTAHLPDSERWALARIGRDARGVIVRAYEHGARFHVSDDPETDPVDTLPALSALLRAARAAGARWLELDADAPEAEGFPVYDWQWTGPLHRASPPSDD